MPRSFSTQEWAVPNSSSNHNAKHVFSKTVEMQNFLSFQPKLTLTPSTFSALLERCTDTSFLVEQFKKLFWENERVNPRLSIEQNLFKASIDQSLC